MNKKIRNALYILLALVFVISVNIRGGQELIILVDGVAFAVLFIWLLAKASKQDDGARDSNSW